MKTKEEVLQNCTIEGNIIKLPNVQLDRKLYQDVAKSLELIGGKWKGGKIFGFVFPNDPTDLLEQIANGEKRNLKKEFQFFATPEILAEKLVELANINSPDLHVLEPSAGQGAIVKALLKKEPDLLVHAYELMDVNRIFLSKIKDCILLGEDFLDSNKQFPQNQNSKLLVYHRDLLFDRIVANPPFTKNSDIEHLQEMYKRLRRNGRIVCITSESWVNGTQKKQMEFKEWLKKLDAEILDIEKGSFKESGTLVGGKIIIIDKK